MPVISRFFGIIVYINWKDHSPPHFHAKYQDDEIIMEIKTGKTTGYFSQKGKQLLNEWREIHLNDLLEDWTLAENNMRLKNISPLE